MARAGVVGAAGSYRRLEGRRLIRVAVAAGLLAATFVLDAMTGPAMLSASEVLSVVFAPGSAEPASRTIVWEFRLPAATLALLVGAALGAAGAEMQAILNNPLASPYTLGFSAAAGFGAALALVFGGSSNWSAVVVPSSSFASAMLAALAIYGLGRMRGGTTETVVLGGVAVHFLFNSGVALLEYVAEENALQAIVFWLFGNLQGATWPRLGVMAVVLAAALLALGARAWRLTALRLGDAHARSLGVDVERLRLQTLVLVSILTAAAVCFAGTIGFIGLVAPHLARTLVGEDQRTFLPLSALVGALLLSAASIASKLIIPGTVVPVGIITALIGVPFFMAIVLGRRGAYR